ncbi:hypothetical protein C7212DRAFT_280545 [Tuber magnatum]|uniref:Uncharacterized protein n=1 Tax=Tuber magnatum TaxID=42249 RepID=A0A317SP43_9PEZI|nr:hypothetical protein C7212DRAFT_280545 [Tuber magnatum]
MAFFTYQITYWAWVKMEKEEVRSEKESTCFSFLFSPFFLLIGRRGGFGSRGGGFEVAGWG